MRTVGIPNIATHTGTHGDGAPTEALMARILGEYREMPGLSLTIAQAAKLWHMEPLTCYQALESLVQQGVLVKNSRGAYRRAADHG